LLIGYTNDLDKDLVQMYSNTGVVHIIAISGMHLGLIYLILGWILSKIPGVQKSAILQYILILSCLWIFSLLTGAGASVIRAAVMFSFILTGKTFSKASSIYNSLAAAAFVMLLYNPFYLWDVGFQLSYLAVIGILVFQKPIYHLIYIKHPWIDKIWELSAVSMAAQLLTFPICIYYFHQFPNLFLISNLVAVPLSSIILFAEIILLALAWMPWVANYIGKLTGLLIQWMNNFISWINDTGIAVWGGLSISIQATLLLYGLLASLAWWWLEQKRK
jgi:competence protein ComEC